MIKNKEFLLVVLVTTLIIGITSWLHGPTIANNYTYLADAWLHGQVDINNWPGTQVDAILYNGKRMVIEAPFPALLVLPLVAIFGVSGWIQTLMSVIVGIIAIALFWILFKRIGLNQTDRLWMCAFTLLGTDLMWCSQLGDVWFYSPVVAVACTALALTECFGKRRGWLIGLAAVCAFESRSTLVFAFLLYPYLMCCDAFTKENIIDVFKLLRGYVIVVGLGLCVWVFYNLIRWGTWNDIGYDLFCTLDPNYCFGSPFGLKYVFYEIYMFFFKAPHLVRDSSVNLTRFPFYTQDSEGVALTFCSPALLFAFWAKRNFKTVSLWITIILIFIPEIFYYVAGSAQVGMRHALDFIPFLIVLMAFALRDNPRHWFYILMGWSILFGIWSCWLWNVGLAGKFLSIN